jgi:hypothetical protein
MAASYDDVYYSGNNYLPNPNYLKVSQSHWNSLRNESLPRHFTSRYESLRDQGDEGPLSSYSEANVAYSDALSFVGSKSARRYEVPQSGEFAGNRSSYNVVPPDSASALVHSPIYEASISRSTSQSQYRSVGTQYESTNNYEEDVVESMSSLQVAVVTSKKRAYSSTKVLFVHWRECDLGPGCMEEINSLEDTFKAKFGYNTEVLQIREKHRAEPSDQLMKVVSEIVACSKDGELIIFYYGGHGTERPYKLARYEILQVAACSMSNFWTLEVARIVMNHL